MKFPTLESLSSNIGMNIWHTNVGIIKWGANIGIVILEGWYCNFKVPRLEVMPHFQGWKPYVDDQWNTSDAPMKFPRITTAGMSLFSCDGGEPQSTNLSLSPAKNTRKVFKQEKNDANCIKLFNCEEETSLSFFIDKWMEYYS